MMSSSCEIENKPKGWKAMLQSWYFWKPFIGFSVGVVAGILYYNYYGSTPGSSPVTSDLYSNALFGGMIGFFIVKRPCSSC
jgi:LytS/YehU family sensor histidine kinase